MGLIKIALQTKHVAQPKVNIRFQNYVILQ